MVAAIQFNGDSATRKVVVTGNYLMSQDYGIEVLSQVTELIVSGNQFLNSGVSVAADFFEGTIVGNDFFLTSGNNNGGVYIETDNSGDILIDSNKINGARRHGIYIDDGPGASGVNDCVISNNLITGPGTQGPANTYDGIHVAGAASRNYIHGNKIIPRSSNGTRYGINMAGSGDCNVIVGNHLGDPANYGTDALAPGTGNILTYPNDPTYGDNFTECPPESP